MLKFTNSTRHASGKVANSARRYHVSIYGDTTYGGKRLIQRHKICLLHHSNHPLKPVIGLPRRLRFWIREKFNDAHFDSLASRKAVRTTAAIIA